MLAYLMNEVFYQQTIFSQNFASIDELQQKIIIELYLPAPKKYAHRGSCALPSVLASQGDHRTPAELFPSSLAQSMSAWLAACKVKVTG